MECEDRVFLERLHALTAKGYEARFERNSVDLTHPKAPNLMLKDGGTLIVVDTLSDYGAEFRKCFLTPGNGWQVIPSDDKNMFNKLLRAVKEPGPIHKAGRVNLKYVYQVSFVAIVLCVFYEIGGRIINTVWHFTKGALGF